MMCVSMMCVSMADWCVCVGGRKGKEGIEGKVGEGLRGKKGKVGKEEEKGVLSDSTESLKAGSG